MFCQLSNDGFRSLVDGVAIGDVIELTVDILDRKLSAGMQGTIVHCHNSEAYEVEFREKVRDVYPTVLQ